MLTVPSIERVVLEGEVNGYVRRDHTRYNEEYVEDKE